MENFCSIDLEKAFDSLEWSFIIRQSLAILNFAPHIISLIISCVSTSSISILVKWKTHELFPSFRGIRHGDPLSPYIFIICMDSLYRIINFSFQERLWQPIRVGRIGILISHLLFADDIILLAKANSLNASTIIHIFNTFAEQSGQKINFNKSSVIFSNNVNSEDRKNLSTVLNICQSRKMGKYLGYPITNHHPKTLDYQYIMDRMNNKLKGWKARMLSLVG